MVREIPSSLRGETELADWFQEYYPSKVVACRIAYEGRKLRSLKKARLKYVKKLEVAQWTLKNKGKRPMTKDGLLEKLGTKVDAIKFYEDKIKSLEDRIKERQQDTFAGKIPKTRVAFVTFDSVFPGTIYQSRGRALIAF